MKVNINGSVKVKLNQLGRDEMERQHEQMRSLYPRCPPYSPVAVDDEGFSKFQIHSLMNTFGHMLLPGLEAPFEPDVFISDQS